MPSGNFLGISVGHPGNILARIGSVCFDTSGHISSGSKILVYNFSFFKIVKDLRFPHRCV
jgi:hypothetical protein